MQERLIRVGVVGLGFGAAVHVPALQSLPGVEVIGIAGRDAHKASAVAAKLCLPIGVGGIEPLLELRPDVVTLALPPDQNEAAVYKAVSAGCAVLCEKPLAMDSSSAKRMVDCLESVGRLTAVDFQFAELTEFQELAAMIRDGRLGRIRHVSVTWLVESYSKKFNQLSWKNDASRAGGVLTLLGSHVLYLAEWLFGPVKRLWTTFNQVGSRSIALDAAGTAEDLIHLRLEHLNGTIFFAVIGNANPGLHVNQWRVIGDNECAVLENLSSDYMRGFVVRTTSGSTQPYEVREPLSVNLIDGRIPPFRRIAQRFIEAVRNGEREFTPSFRDGLRIQDLMTFAHQSANSGSSVEVPTA